VVLRWTVHSPYSNKQLDFFWSGLCPPEKRESRMVQPDLWEVEEGRGEKRRERCFRVLRTVRRPQVPSENCSRSSATTGRECEVCDVAVWRRHSPSNESILGLEQKELRSRRTYRVRGTRLIQRKKWNYMKKIYSVLNRRCENDI